MVKQPLNNGNINKQKTLIMKFNNYKTLAFSLIVLFVGQVALAQYGQKPKVDPNNTIVENAMAVDDLSTLVSAVKAADLVATLSSEGPFTVFAPTNDAFSELGEDTLTMVMDEENKEMLAGILTYHVVAGDVKAADVLALIADNDGEASVETVNGGTLTFWTKYNKVYVRDANGNDAEVIMANVANSNGTVHVINKVLMPASK